MTIEKRVSATYQREHGPQPYSYGHKGAARAFGIMFILAFLFYGTGSALMESVVSATDILDNVQLHKPAGCSRSS